MTDGTAYPFRRRFGESRDAKSGSGLCVGGFVADAGLDVIQAGEGDIRVKSGLGSGAVDHVQGGPAAHFFKRRGIAVPSSAIYGGDMPCLVLHLRP